MGAACCFGCAEVACMLARQQQSCTFCVVMLKIRRLGMRFFLSVIILSAAALAQQPGELQDAKPSQSAQQQAQPAPVAPPGMVVIPAGTEIPLKLAQAITTKNAKVGDPVYAETAFPFTINDRVVIPAGTYVQGRISDVRRPGRVKGRAELLMHFT